MGRPKGSTWNTDSKIILALLYKPRSFSEFEYALVEEFSRSWADEDTKDDPRMRELLVKMWRIPRRTLARRLKQLVAKGWVKREIAHKHGHHVIYSLNFSKRDEILEAMPKPEVPADFFEDKFARTVRVGGSLRMKFPQLRKLPTDKIVDIYLRLQKGEFICPNCLIKGEEALNVHRASDGRFYCRNCGEEISADECNKLLKEVMLEAFKRVADKAFMNLERFFEAIDKQLKEGKTNNVPF